MTKMVHIKTIKNVYYDLDALVYEDENSKELMIEVNGGFFHLDQLSIEEVTEKMLFQMAAHCLYDDPDSPEQYIVSLKENQLVIEDTEDA